MSELGDENYDTSVGQYAADSGDDDDATIGGQSGMSTELPVSLYMARHSWDQPHTLKSDGNRSARTALSRACGQFGGERGGFGLHHLQVAPASCRFWLLEYGRPQSRMARFWRVWRGLACRVGPDKGAPPHRQRSQLSPPAEEAAPSRERQRQLNLRCPHTASFWGLPTTAGDWASKSVSQGTHSYNS